MLADLTHPITADCPVYPGSPAPRLTPAADMERDHYRETLLTIGSHTGTHMDAPRHIFPDGAALDTLPPDRFRGDAVVADVTGLTAVTAGFLRSLEPRLRQAEFLLLRSGYDQYWGTARYLTDAWPVLTVDAARYLLTFSLKGVGVDSLSVDRLTGDLPIHRILLGSGLVLVENLRLSPLAGTDTVRFFALPLHYANADGAPVRAVAEFTPKERDLP
ncbi:cyclase family protein [Dysosmobacter sp.]|uniref:cyclase family protein n=1 Tax=Dysosmobacter sp. TaxID=2591382 RepID=UPI002A8EA24B|nr:cyclase family protein [Dysosmobacter sp.]MDY3281179.1 cyclase family protein [Dysosmobacter sp.]